MVKNNAGFQVSVAKKSMGILNERGSSMAWAAVFLAFVVVPFLSLIADGARMFYVRGRLQTATDAACEDVAWSAADRSTFRDTGVTTFDLDPSFVIQGQNIFNHSLSEQIGKKFHAGLTITINTTARRVECAAQASIPLFTTLGQLYSPVTIEAVSVSTIRFTQN